MTIALLKVLIELAVIPLAVAVIRELRKNRDLTPREWMEVCIGAVAEEHARNPERFKTGKEKAEEALRLYAKKYSGTPAGEALVLLDGLLGVVGEGAAVKGK